MSETSEIVGLWSTTAPLDEFAEWARGFPEGTMVNQGHFGFEARSPGDICGCYTCDQRDRGALADLTGMFSIRLTGLMILCPDCGNKRCPKATHHDYACTASNEPGQAGSRYA